MGTRRTFLVAALLLCAIALLNNRLSAGDDFLKALSNVATREARKEVRDKRIHFAQGPLEGDLQAIEPDTHLEVEVQDFKLANDLVTATVAARGRLQLDGKVDKTQDIRTILDVRLTTVITARFLKEGDKFYVEPRINQLAVALNILELAPADLSGGEELFSTLAMAAFNNNKDKILAEINRRLGKRAF